MLLQQSCDTNYGMIFTWHNEFVIRLVATMRLVLRSI